MLVKVEDFSLAQTLECGQCFHFEKIEDDHYVFVHKDKAYDIKQLGDKLELINATEDEFEDILVPYFDLQTDYKTIRDTLIKKDDKLRNSIEEMQGIHILKQDFFETLMSFIISANNQIPRIQKSVKLISQKYGKFLGTFYGINFYAFPTPDELVDVKEEEFRELGVGFRDKYLVEAVKYLVDGKLDMDKVYSKDEDVVIKELMKIKGVGLKVASCITLFSLSLMTAFPIDVWIKRIMQNLYFNGEKTDNKEILKLAREKFYPYEGYAQQYLFHYGRSMK